MAIENGLLIAKVAHSRSRPKKNQFVYSMYYLCFPLAMSAKLKNAILALKRFHLFSFYPGDYGDGREDLEGWVREVLAKHDIADVDIITLLTLPRHLGYSFNPISFFFCTRADGGLRAVLCEVNNTFGDRHYYLSVANEGEIIQKNQTLQSNKLMHVSPYCDVSGHYRFRFAYDEGRVGAWIDYYDEEGLLISTSITGHRHALNTKNLFRCFWRYPIITFKVTFLIHYQALKLWLKGIRYRRRPAPHITEITR